MEVCFVGAEDADVVGSNEAAGVYPVRPIIIRANSSGILEGNTKCGGCFGRASFQKSCSRCCGGSILRFRGSKFGTEIYQTSTLNRSARWIGSWRRFFMDFDRFGKPS